MTGIRKQVYDLTLDDFTRFPVWEHALDEEGEPGQDEATVRPYRTLGALDESEGLFVVKASFVLANGTPCQGCLYASENRDVGYVQPAIITPRGQVAFWRGILTPKAEEVATAYERLGKNAGEVFPLRYRSEVPLRHGMISGTVPAFLSRPADKIVETR